MTWLLWIPAGLVALAGIGATATFVLRFTPSALEPSESTVDGLSVIVPIRGIDANTEANLDALLSSRVPVPVEYLIAMESDQDPAHSVARHVRDRHPEVTSSIVLTGPAGERMGKQHNLSGALTRARYQVIASMDADVQVDPDTLAVGLRHLSEPDAGVAYLLPQYTGPGRAGGLLVALYSNYYYQLNMGALALSRDAPFITGGLWLMSARARATLGGLDQFAGTVSDDAAIGRAVVAAGLRNVLVPRTVRIRYEDLSLTGGAAHLLKWLALLRAEGLATYLAIAGSWHLVLVSALTAVLAVVLGGSVLGAVAVLGSAALVRFASALVLHAKAYGWRGVGASVWLPAYEVLAVPVLFGLGLFRRHVVWRGTRYQIGKGGVIVSARDTGR